MVVEVRPFLAHRDKSILSMHISQSVLTYMDLIARTDCSEPDRRRHWVETEIKVPVITQYTAPIGP